MCAASNIVSCNDFRNRSDPDIVLTSPVNEAIVTAVDAKSRDAFDAVVIIDETNEAAQGRLSSRARQMLQTLLAE